jgi:ribonuclease G
MKSVENELIIDVKVNEISIALLEDKRVVELHKETRQATSYSVGDIYIGRVKKLMPGLNAAFIDVGYEKDAFLHYLDLGSHFQALHSFSKQLLSNRKRIPELETNYSEINLDKNGSISDVLKVGQEIPVQITKEPISTKGPRLTSELSIAGRYLVLIPFAEKVSVSQKIRSNEEKNRLKRLIQSIKPKGFGVIIRTVAEEKGAAELDNELKILIKRWEETVVKMQQSNGIALVCEEIGRMVGIIRDIFNSSFENIYINEENYYKEVKEYIKLIDPSKKEIVKLYKDDIPIFDKFDITKQIKSSFGKIVAFKNGAYLIIEHTEAMHVIDVNSGNRAKLADGQEANALAVNMAAAEEIARQLRLRDMGGIISIDFIDMLEGEHKNTLYEHMKSLMAHDRAKHNVLPLSKFCVMQITRQRVRPVIDIDVEETCPTCYGKGKMLPSILFTDQLEEKINTMINQLGIKKFYLHIHPYVCAYIKQGFPSLEWKWKWKYGFGCNVVPSQQLGFLQFKFYNHKKEEINMKAMLEEFEQQKNIK